MNSQQFLSRRRFLGRSFQVGAGAALASLTDIPFVMKRALADGSIGLQGKKLLFIWLRGANDSLNSVIPINDPAYATSRPTLRIPKDAGTDYNATTRVADFPTGSATNTYSYANAITLRNGFAALHPKLKFLAPVYNAGDLALVHRVGYARQSRSHFDSQNYWENGDPRNDLLRSGIFYRAMIESGLANTAPLTGVSIQSSLPLILRGDEAAMTNLSDPNRYDLLGIPNNADGNAKAFTNLVNSTGARFPAKNYRDLLQLQYGNLRNTLSIFAGINFTESGNVFQDDVKTDGDTNWVPIDANGNSIGDAGRGYFLFPTTSDKNGGWRRPDKSVVGGKFVVNTAHHDFFTNLKAAAMVLNKTDAIVCGTELGGFDTHKNQGGDTGSHPDLQKVIGWSMYALRKYFSLYADKATWENIVVVTLSEFGRTTVENSDLGTDHAEASTMFVAGGGVRGGVYNANASGDPIAWNTGAGGAMFGVEGRYLRRTTDFRSVLGELIRDHLGATQTQLGRIIPGYTNAGERLLTPGVSSIDGTQVTGEINLI